LYFIDLVFQEEKNTNYEHKGLDLYDMIDDGAIKSGLKAIIGSKYMTLTIKL
jgi:hypothetical protein